MNSAAFPRLCIDYKYWKKDWKWKQTKAKMLEKARKIMATVCALGIRRQDLSVKAAVHAWEALVLPILCVRWVSVEGEKKNGNSVCVGYPETGL